LLEDVLLRVKKDVEVWEVESLVNHFLDLLLGLRRQLSTIDILPLLRVVVDLRAALISVILLTLVALHWSHIILEKRSEDLI
jgi:hypothetical protein